MPNEIVRPAVEKKDYSKLKEYDELMTSFKNFKDQAEGHFLYKEFTEGEINFPPTYKYDKKTNKYDSSKK